MFEVLPVSTVETITQNGQEIQVTAIATPSTSLTQVWSEIYASPTGVHFTLKTDEERMTEAVNNTIASAGFGDNVSNLNVRLNNSLITVEFGVTFGTASANGRITISAFAQTGKAVITMTSVQFGQLILPQEFLDALNAAIAHALTGAANENQAQVTIDEITIDNGEMEITGTVGI